MTLPAYEKLGVFLSRPGVQPDTKRSGDEVALRFARPDHARGLHRHDGQRQDGPVPVAARGSGPRRHPGNCDRPQGRHRQPGPDVSRLAARGLQPMGRRRGSRTQRAVRGRVCRGDGRSLAQGARRMGRGWRAHPAFARRGQRHDLYARFDVGAAAVDPALARARRMPRPLAMPRRSRKASALRSRDCWDCSVSTRTRCAAGNSCCSRRCSMRRGARDESLDLAALIQAVQKPPFDKVGVFDLESFYPARDRTELALAHQRPARVARLRMLAAR